MRVAFARIGLPAWFIVIDLLWIAKPDVLGIDARHYQRAASEWLAGGDPWKVTEGGIPFAAGPHTLLFYAPTSLLPLSVSVGGLDGPRRRGRGLDGPAAGHPDLVGRVPAAGPRALERQPAEHRAGAAGRRRDDRRDRRGRAEALRGGARWSSGRASWPSSSSPSSSSLPLLPWQLYITDGFGVSSHLSSAWNGSAWRIPILIPPTLLGLWILRHKGAEWFAVPAVWPATQFYYVSMAMPAVISMPLAAAALALPLPLMTPVLVMVLAAIEVRQTGLAAALGRPTPPPAAPAPTGARILERR